jgi:methyl-accepting chemotaxis protein
MRFTISTKVALLALVNAIIVAATVAGAGIVIADREASKNATRAIERNMRIAWHEADPTGEGIRRIDGRLMVGGTALDGNFALVDKVVELGAGTATIFNGDTRVATNVKKDDGSRAVGTKLARNAAYEAIFTQKKPVPRRARHSRQVLYRRLRPHPGRRWRGDRHRLCRHPDGDF